LTAQGSSFLFTIKAAASC